MEYSKFAKAFRSFAESFALLAEALEDDARYCENTGRKGIVGLQGFSCTVLEVLGQVGIEATKRVNRSGAHITSIRLRRFEDEGIAALM